MQYMPMQMPSFMMPMMMPNPMAMMPMADPNQYMNPSKIIHSKVNE